MRIEETIVNIIFDAGKGSTPQQSREGVCGRPYGELPRPMRSGYEFAGWYLGEELITAESILTAERDVRLTARWERKSGEKKKNSVMHRQKLTALVLAIVIVFLGVAVAVANRLVAIYYLTDRYYNEAGEEQSDRYTIKKENGVYKLFDRKGNLMETTENGYTSSSDGVRYEVYVAAASGNQYLINTATGEYETYAIVDYDSAIGESLGGTVKNKRIMMFPRVGQDNTYSITVTNQYGSYEFYRKTVENTAADATKKYTTTVHIKGTEETLTTYDPTLFASLCVSTGYTLTMQKLDFGDAEAPRLPDGSIDYNAYGLVDRYDEEGKLIYSPAVYTIVKANYAADGSCTASDTSYTVKVGDAILSGGGYYVQLVGRDAVYITSSEIGKTVLQPVEALVAPASIYPMTVSTYVMVHDFRLGLIQDFLSEDEPSEDSIKLLAAFDFIDLEQRENTVYSSVPYWLTEKLSVMNGYQFNSDSVSTVLNNLYSMEFVSCKVLNPTSGEKEGEPNHFEEYSLTEDVYYLSFRYDPEVANGGSDEENWIDNILIISPKTEDGTYYVYSYLYDMIVEVDQYYLSFLEWDQNKWYNQYFFQNNIAYMKEISFTMGDKTYSFTLDNTLTHAFYDKGDGTGALVDATKGSITQDAEGNYYYTITKTGQKYRMYLMDYTAGRTYRDESTSKIMYKSENGIVVEVPTGSTNMQVIHNAADGSHTVDYTIENTYTTDSGTQKTETISSLDNFRRLYSKLLWYSIEGDVNPAELGGDVTNYIASHAATAEIRFSLSDMASVMNPEHYAEDNQRHMIVRLYQYSERKMLLTIEVLSDPDATPDPTKAQGSFYVLASEMNNLMKYAEQFLAQELLPKNL